MRLFDATVTSSVLYGSGCWAMTVERTRRLQTEERKMLRRIVQTPRRHFELADMSVEQESWVDWVTRATRRAEGLFRRAGYRSWGYQQRGRKRQLQSRIQQREDGRWSTKLLEWAPEGVRVTGRPRKRLAD